ncbi:hypothetical protein P175DRAFT_0428866 [Aspergillus ochraceoroseus IBT 24754]|uniref:Zn(2)-C6 fungal-type domain-containing protein n=3 Tax=Aspergillus subgen. Nidulantes TaxID=2720870 RepID=A0A0F8V648_9EURO|nr:uncharacterized protein P175DRAFT_0428866 [Aspergillus ochraceoroseus IBT 24754]KKK18461.1 hypothetical protein ARAM_007460 [Aspergillus rambellii]PTU24573.1 hypothetical protein P175DRAFT_0428866 [Aspergillus ochraceoroseus IBT 24754]
MADDDDHRPLKRIRQACDPCRRKKSRCPGEKPACSYCERLGQQCVYSQGDGEAPTGDIAKRLLSVEEKLEELTRSLRPQPNREETQQPAVESNLRQDDLSTVAQLFLTCCNYQPLPLFHPEGFLQSLGGRDPELILAVHAVGLRFGRSPDGSDLRPYIEECARKSRALVMARVGRGVVELSTLQTLCLLAMFDFTAGDPVQAGLHLNMASYLAQSVSATGEALGALRAADADEKRRCLWSIYLLQSLQGDGVQTPRLIVGVRTPFNSGSGFSSTYDLTSIPDCAVPNFKEEYDLVSYTIQLGEVWSLAMGYAASRVEPDAPPPWSPRSDYSIVTYRHMEFDSRVPLKYRYDANRFHEHRLHELNRRREFWGPWLFTQFLYLAIPCLLNHPFLLSRRLRSFRHTMPQSFIRQSFEAITNNAAWILHLIDLIEHKGFEICDPTLAHCVLIVATIHLQHSFVEDASFREKARRGFTKCVRFLHPLAQRWPHIQNMIDRLNRLRENVSAGDPQASRSRQAWTTNAQLLWELLVYDSASRTPLPTHLFGTTLSDSSGRLNARMTPDPNFPLVGSAGISGHKSVAKEIFTYPPETITTPPAVQMDEAPVAAVSMADPFGPIGGSVLEGVTDHLFLEPESYGRAIEDWWEGDVLI